MARRRKRGRAAKHARRAQLGMSEKANAASKVPRTMVFHRGQVGGYVLHLVQDLRRLMEPYTASNLGVKKTNVFKDFVSVAGPLGVSHFWIFTKTAASVNLRIMKVPRGPTLTFRVKEYVLTRDVVTSLKRPVSYQSQFAHAPLLVMNNLNTGSENSHKLVQHVFQNMFPGLNVNTIDVNNVRRCVLLHHNSDTDTMELRHYTIKMVPVGISRSAKKLAQGKMPKLGRYDDISDYFLQPGQLSESEYENDPENEVDISQGLSSRGCADPGKCGVRLIELGPRLSLELVKIEEGLSDGEVLYHKYVHKSPEEVAELADMKHRKRKLKEKRKRIQGENVKKKARLREEHKERCLAGMTQPLESTEETSTSEPTVPKRQPKFKVNVGVKPKGVKEKLDDSILRKMRSANRNRKTIQGRSKPGAHS